MGFTPDEIDTLKGATAFDADGQKLGGVSQVYLDDSTGDPTWVTVSTGLFGTQESFVPLREAAIRGGELHVTVDKATVKDAPRLEADGHLTPDEEQELYRYYGIDDARRDEAPTVAGGGVEPEGQERPSVDDRVDGDDVRDDRARDNEDAAPAAGGPVVTQPASSPRTDDDADDGVRDDRARTSDADADTDADADADDDQDRRAETRGGSDDTESDEPRSDEPRSDEPRAHEPIRESESDDAKDLELNAGETQSRLRRYVVTERVTRTVEELPDDDNR